MSIFRLQNSVPEVYINKSRDFQLLCRLYDVIFNGIKYDVDGIERIINTENCKSTIVQLLQTKLGFFTDRQYNDETLRTYLRVFPKLTKGKGTQSAIENALYTFLKINNIDTNIKVTILDTDPTDEQKLLFGNKVTKHSIVIGIDSNKLDISILKEVLKYIIPFGYGIFFYFFSDQQSKDYITHDDYAKLILVSNDVNDMAGSKSNIVDKDWDTSTQWYSDEFKDKFIASINTTEVRKDNYTNASGTEILRDYAHDILTDTIDIPVVTTNKGTEDE